MKPSCMPFKSLLEFDCKIEVLMEMPNAISAESAFYARKSGACQVQLPAPAPYYRDRSEELALRVEALRESPYAPDIAWMC